MSILGIEEITFGVTDLAKCRQFFEDWGLSLVASEPQRLVFECLNGCRVVVAHGSAEGLAAGVEPRCPLGEREGGRSESSHWSVSLVGRRGSWLRGYLRGWPP